MKITNTYVYEIVKDKKILDLMESYLDDLDIRKIYKQWNFWSPEVERFGDGTVLRYNYEVAFIGKVLSAVSMVQPYVQIEWHLSQYHDGNTAALLFFVLNNVKWSVLESAGKRIFEGSLLPEAEVEERQEREEEEKDKKQILLEKVQKEIIDEYPAFKEVFYKKYRNIIAERLFQLGGNPNGSIAIEQLIEDEMIEDFSNFKIKQIENLLKNS